jgi:hypothetical protein
MSKVVNDVGMPAEMFKALFGFQFTPLGPDEIRVTELNTDIRQVMLRRRHTDVEVPVKTQWNFILGNAMHEYIGQRIRRQDNVVVADNVRFSVDVDGVKVSGKPDLMLGGVVYDYKTTSVFGAGDIKYSYKVQLSIYAWMMRKKGIMVEKGVLVQLFKDWTKKSKTPQPLMFTEVELMTDAEVEAFLHAKIAEFVLALTMEDADLPACADDAGFNKCAYCEFAGTGLCNKERK